MASQRSNDRAKDHATPQPTPDHLASVSVRSTSMPLSSEDAERVSQARSLLGSNQRSDEVPLTAARLLSALTHRGYLPDDPNAGPSYERQEFLGDAVLGLVAAEFFVDAFPNADEGELTQRRAAWVSEPSLAAAARRHGLHKLIRWGKSQRAVGDEALPSVLADVIEALLATIYIEHGYAAAYDGAIRLIGAPKMALNFEKSAKSELQERLQSVFSLAPNYLVTRADGPDHAPRFNAEVLLSGVSLGSGDGTTKKSATGEAAVQALRNLQSLDDDALRNFCRGDATDSVATGSRAADSTRRVEDSGQLEENAKAVKQRPKEPAS